MLPTKTNQAFYYIPNKEIVGGSFTLTDSRSDGTFVTSPSYSFDKLLDTGPLEVAFTRVLGHSADAVAKVGRMPNGAFAVEICGMLAGTNIFAAVTINCSALVGVTGDPVSFDCGQLWAAQ